MTRSLPLGSAPQVLRRMRGSADGRTDRWMDRRYQTLLMYYVPALQLIKITCKILYIWWYPGILCTDSWLCFKVLILEGIMMSEWSSGSFPLLLSMSVLQNIVYNKNTLKSRHLFSSTTSVNHIRWQVHHSLHTFPYIITHRLSVTPPQILYKALFSCT